MRPHPLAPQTGGMVQKAMGMHGRVQDKVRVMLCLFKFEGKVVRIVANGGGGGGGFEL